MSEPSPASETTIRRRDPERTRQDILAVATAEFAANGFDGARVDEIAALTQTTKRMIYYYFDSKEGLYLRVIEAAYQGIRNLEQTLDVDGLPPVEGLRRLAETTFDHHTTHRDFVRLVAIENIHRAEHISNSTTIPDLNSTAIATLSKVLERGIADGSFRPGRRRARHPRDDQRLCDLPRREPLHVPHLVRSRSARSGAPRPLPRARRRHGGGDRHSVLRPIRTTLDRMIEFCGAAACSRNAPIAQW